MREINLAQNLKDAGCSSNVINQFMDLYQPRSLAGQKRILNDHRGSLLEAIHKNQKKLDCLDFLIYQLKLENQPKS